MKQHPLESASMALARRTSRRGILANASRVVVGLTGGTALMNASMAYAQEEQGYPTPLSEEEIGVEDIAELLAGSCCYCWSTCNCYSASPPYTRRLKIVYCCPCCECSSCPEHKIKSHCSRYAC